MTTRRRYDAQAAATIIEEFDSEDDNEQSDDNFAEDEGDASDIETEARLIHPHGDIDSELCICP